MPALQLGSRTARELHGLSGMAKRISSGVRLLSISSDRQVRHQLLSGLAHIGLAARTLTTVRSVPAATAALDRLRPRLVVLDDGLRDLDAQAFISTVHQHGSEILVVYLATQHTPELERTVRQSGVLYYTEKPLDEDVLLRILRVVLGPAHSLEPSPLRS